MDVPSEDDIYTTVEVELGDSRYRERLARSNDAAGMGRATALVYLIQGGRSYLREARRLGGAIGQNTRIVDDILDGDGCDPVEDRERFLDNYVESVEEGTVSAPVEVSEELAAYEAGRQLHEALAPYDDVLDDVVGTFEAMGEAVVDEDKETVEGYRDYVHAAGGLHGELCVEALDVFPDYELTEERRDFAYDFGRAAQVVDDLFDEDVELEDGDLDDELDRVFADLDAYGYRSVDILTSIDPRDLRALMTPEDGLQRLREGIRAWKDGVVDAV